MKQKNRKINKITEWECAILYGLTHLIRKTLKL